MTICSLLNCTAINFVQPIGVIVIAGAVLLPVGEWQQIAVRSNIIIVNYKRSIHIHRPYTLFLKKKNKRNKIKRKIKK